MTMKPEMEIKVTENAFKSSKSLIFIIGRGSRIILREISPSEG